MKVLTLGTFDLFHAGHVRFLERCRELAGGEYGMVVVGLNTDAFAESYKRRPMIDYEGRKAVLEACRYVDIVIPNAQPGGSAVGVVRTVTPHIVAATMDYHPSNGKDWYKQVGISREWFDDHDIIVEWIPYTTGVSSTDILSRIG